MRSSSLEQESLPEAQQGLACRESVHALKFYAKFWVFVNKYFSGFCCMFYYWIRPDRWKAVYLVPMLWINCFTEHALVLCLIYLRWRALWKAAVEIHCIYCWILLRILYTTQVISRPDCTKESSEVSVNYRSEVLPGNMYC